MNFQKYCGNNITLFLGLLSTMTISFAAQALTIEVDPRGLTTTELEAGNVLVQKAIAMLPPSVKEEMATHIKLEFRNLGKEGKWGVAQHKILTEDKILLDRSLLPDIVAGVKNSRQNLRWATKFATFYDIALGTILHEIAHFFDDLQSPPISSYNEFLQLNYFKNTKSKSRNTLAAKSPNWYEFSSSAEAFAVNFEFFLLDPEFKCRKPLLYDYYAGKIFNYSPYAHTQCSRVNKVYETGNVLENGKSGYIELEFNRLYQVHYLMADKGNDLSSKWGHSMIRLVFCAPERSAIGPECLKDLAYHKVLSFRAVPTSDTVSFTKGLTGKYPSLLFILPFTQVIHDYTVDELRPVKSVPLKMTNDQMKKLFLRTLEVHWSYRGKYYFINNNCAVETLNLVKTILSDLAGLEDLAAITPQGVLNVLNETGVTDISAFNDINYAWRQGLYYYPNDKVPKLAYSKLKKNSRYLTKLTFKEFLFDSNPTMRENVYREILERDFRSKAELNEFYASAMYLEKQIYKQQRKKLYTDAMLKLADVSNEETKNYTKVITWTESWYYGYGIPSEKDYQDYYIAPNKRNQSHQKELADSMNKKIESLWDIELKQQLAHSQENLKYIKTVYENKIKKF